MTVPPVRLAAAPALARLVALAALVASMLHASNALAGPGWPTFDAANLAQLEAQMRQLRSQYKLLQQHHASLTGSYGRGQLGLSESIAAASAIPGSWQEVVAIQARGAYGQRQAMVDKQIGTIAAEMFRDPKGRAAASYGHSSGTVRAALAGGDVLYAQVQTHLNNLTRMSQQVDHTANVKDAQDLQNRIATESGMLQSALGKVNALNMHLQADLVNRQNQATADNERFFRWK